MNIYTFEYFWAEYHRINRSLKTGKDLCRNYWNKHFNNKLKKYAIQHIKKTDKSPYEYLKSKLNYIDLSKDFG